MDRKVLCASAARRDFYVYCFVFLLFVLLKALKEQNCALPFYFKIALKSGK